jgi:hypothetical protein
MSTKLVPDYYLYRTDGSTPDKTDGYSMQHPTELTPNEEGEL